MLALLAGWGNVVLASGLLVAGVVILCREKVGTALTILLKRITSHRIDDEPR